jgi:hypothetical protein
MNQIQNNKKNDDLDANLDDDLDDDEPLCNCNLCWLTRQVISILPNSILFRNPFVVFIFIFILPVIFILIILMPFILFILKN